MDHASTDVSATDTGFLVSGYGPKDQGVKGLPTTIAWVESGVIKVEVSALGGPAQLPCGKAYTDGYMGFAFQSY